MAGEEAIILLFGSLAALAAVLVAGFGKGWFAGSRSTNAPNPTSSTPTASDIEVSSTPELVTEAEAQTAQAYAAMERVADALEAQAVEIDSASHGRGSLSVLSASMDPAEASNSEIAEVTGFEPPVTVYDPPFPSPSSAIETSSASVEQAMSTETGSADSEIPAAIVSPMPVAVTAPKRSRRSSSTPRTRRTRTKRNQ